MNKSAGQSTPFGLVPHHLPLDVHLCYDFPMSSPDTAIGRSEVDPTAHALEWVGGFDRFQALVREALRKAAKRISASDLKHLDQRLASMGYTVDGLSQGVNGVVRGTCEEPLTWDNIQTLELTLRLSVCNLLQPLLEPHLMKGKPGAPLGLFTDKEHPDGLDRRSGEFLDLVIAVDHQSDEEIQRRKEARRGSTDDVRQGS